MGLEEWWEANFDWLDPERADTVGLVTLGFMLMVLTLAASYGIAYWWHKHKDKKSSE